MTEILFLAHRIPYPPDKGDKIRSWHILRHLAKQATVHLGAFVDDPADMAHAAKLRDICGDVMLRPLDSGAGRLSRALRGLAARRPLSLALFDDPAMHAWTASVVRNRPIDGIFVFSGQMAPYALPHAAGRRTIMDFVDIDSDKWRQYAEEASGPRRWLYAREAGTLLAFEQAAAAQVDASLFVSEAEAALFRRLAPNAQGVAALNNGVDYGYFDPAADFSAELKPGRPNFVFTGAMDYRPNIDAVAWFADHVWPLLRTARPDASFTIVGSKPAPEVQALARRDGIAVTGRVEDVRPYIAAADVVVAPLRIARGIQNKVLEAMAMAKPVVATTPAFEGIEATPGEHLVVADDPRAFSDAALALANDTDRASSLGKAARQRVLERYDWATNLSTLDRMLGLGAADTRPVGIALP